ncbi:MAG: hypothetical protein IH949_12690 [Bacteroidetes bacterium]|nr:hypothetical protein [Bacteroidota bacterium]
MRFLYFFLIASLLFSCNQESKIESPDELISKQVGAKNTEEYKELDITEINKKITNSVEKLTPEVIMRMYYPYKVETSEGNEIITMHTTRLNKENVEVILIHDNFLDDSVKGEKYVLYLKNIDSKWIVISLKKNWKCRDGRGHKDWGIGLCK